MAIHLGKTFFFNFFLLKQGLLHSNIFTAIFGMSGYMFDWT